MSLHRRERVVVAAAVSGPAVLTDDQWEQIRPLLPSSEGRRGRPFRDHRPVVEGILYRYRCGIAWRDVPEQFGPWQTVWNRHRRYSADGTWDRILAALLTEAQKVELNDRAVSVDPPSTAPTPTPRTPPTTQRTGPGPRVRPRADRALHEGDPRAPAASGHHRRGS